MLCCTSRPTAYFQHESFLRSRGPHRSPRLRLPQMVLASTEPAVDAGCVDSAGLTVLHRVAEALDLSYLGLLLEERQKSQGKLQQHGVVGMFHTKG